jgi:hypothetical protein
MEWRDPARPVTVTIRYVTRPADLTPVQLGGGPAVNSSFRRRAR